MKFEEQNNSNIALVARSSATSLLAPTGGSTFAPATAPPAAQQPNSIQNRNSEIKNRITGLSKTFEEMEGTLSLSVPKPRIRTHSREFAQIRVSLSQACPQGVGKEFPILVIIMEDGLAAITSVHKMIDSAGILDAKFSGHAEEGAVAGPHGQGEQYCISGD